MEGREEGEERGKEGGERGEEGGERGEEGGERGGERGEEWDAWCTATAFFVASTAPAT